MLGTYNTRSATTKPTGKNRLDAGINGNTINTRLCNNNQTLHVDYLQFICHNITGD